MGTQVADNSKKTCLGGKLLIFLFLAFGIGGPVLYMTTMSGDPEPTPPPTRGVRQKLSRFKQPDPITPQGKPDAKVPKKSSTAAQKPKPKVLFKKPKAPPKKSTVPPKKPKAPPKKSKAPPKKPKAPPKKPNAPRKKPKAPPKKTNAPPKKSKAPPKKPKAPPKKSKDPHKKLNASIKIPSLPNQRPKQKPKKKSKWKTFGKRLLWGLGITALVLPITIGVIVTKGDLLNVLAPSYCSSASTKNQDQSGK